MTQLEASSRQAQAPEGGTTDPQPPAGWYLDPKDANYARYWDGTAFGEQRVLVAPTRRVTAWWQTMGRGLAGMQMGWRSSSNRRVPGPRTYVGRPSVVLRSMLLTIGGVLVLLALIDEIGGDMNDLAPGTFAVGICFIVAVVAEMALGATRTRTGTRTHPRGSSRPRQLRSGRSTR
jgi:Protein of unknown function (DUF2510)